MVNRPLLKLKVYHARRLHDILLLNRKAVKTVEEKKSRNPRKLRYGPDGSREHPQLTPEMVRNIEKRLQERKAKKDSKAKQ